MNDILSAMVQQWNATMLMNVLKEPFLFLDPNLRMDFNLMKITEESLKLFKTLKSGLLIIEINFKLVQVVETDNQNYALIVTCLNVTETQVGSQFFSKIPRYLMCNLNGNSNKRYEYFSILYRDTKCFASSEQDEKILNVLNDLGLRIVVENFETGQTCILNYS